MRARRCGVCAYGVRASEYAVSASLVGFGISAGSANRQHAACLLPCFRRKASRRARVARKRVSTHRIEMRTVLPICQTASKLQPHSACDEHRCAVDIISSQGCIVMDTRYRHMLKLPTDKKIANIYVLFYQLSQYLRPA